MKANRPGTWLIAGGVLLILAALGLCGYNLWEQKQAADTASDALEAILAQVDANRETEPAGEATQPQDEPLTPETPEKPEPSEPVSVPEIPDYLRDPQMEMPTVEYDGQDYLGVVEIPSLGLRLPVISRWSYPRLKIAPCRYSGSAYENDLIIMAHNYQSHFGKLEELRPGDEVYFTDMDGNVFCYEVMELETLAGNAVAEMSAGAWDLTLFTCTLGGMTRVTVRCQRV